jgi:crotonobetainyl-CoA:carnitine CoA-transferase CaiB-like acyl-CoA transferase
MQPLEGILVLDFSTLLPGPLATLMLAEAGAKVVKIERPGRGDEMRTYMPRVGADSINFQLLNRRKQSLEIDLKDPGAVTRLTPLIEQADVLVEQFRPQVMQSLGLGYEAVRQINPRLIYCSITGWGQSGPKCAAAGHDLNYMAETGVLALSAGHDGAPSLPPVLAADIAAGSYPAVMNILLALRQRERTGQGTHLDVAMCDGLFTFAYWALGNGVAANAWPRPGKELLTGGSPRYQVYRTADHRHVAAAPLEEKFWNNFCHIISLPEALRPSQAPPGAVIAKVAEIIASRTADEWRRAFAGQDVCCSIVMELEEAVRDPHTAARRVFDQQLLAGDQVLPALPVPISSEFRSQALCARAPRLGEHCNDLEPE